MGCGLNRGKTIKITKKKVNYPLLKIERIDNNNSLYIKMNSNSIFSDNNQKTRENSGHYQKQFQSKILCAKISENNWSKVIDYLNFKELKEVGKINKYFNYLAKQDRVLVKFFSKKQNKNFKTESKNKNIIYISLN